jgi:hypothetical protein
VPIHLGLPDLLRHPGRSALRFGYLDFGRLTCILLQLLELFYGNFSGRVERCGFKRL